MDIEPSPSPVSGMADPLDVFFCLKKNLSGSGIR